jgi:hypothetical protein
MTNRTPEAAPQTYARLGGLLYLFIIVAALFGEAYVRGNLLVARDPIATAGNILGSATLFRVGLAGELLTCVCDVAVTLILYVLLKPVSRNLALLAAFFRLTFVAVYSVAKLFEIAALAVLDGADYLKGFNAQQLDDLAYVALRVHGLGYGVSLLFFGFSCILFGYLMRKSLFLPQILGILFMIGGLGYILFSVAQVLSPSFAARYLFPWLMLPAFPAELGLALWLTLKGVNVPKWKERAQA